MTGMSELAAGIKGIVAQECIASVRPLEGHLLIGLLERLKALAKAQYEAAGSLMESRQICHRPREDCCYMLRWNYRCMQLTDPADKRSELRRPLLTEAMSGSICMQCPGDRPLPKHTASRLS